MISSKLSMLVFKRHKHILLVLTLVVIVSFIINIFISKNTIFFAGEYIYSFDYFGHVNNIINDYLRLGLSVDNTNCNDCPDFYHYSRWYSLVKIGYLSIGQLLHLNAFVFLVLSMTCLLLIGLYIFSRICFKNFYIIPFLIASYFYIFYPYRYSLFVETHDGTIHSSILILISLVIILFRNFEKFNSKQLFIYSFLAGIFFSSFFNINIGYIPIVFYLVLICSTFFLKYLFTSFNKIVILVTASIIPVIVINIPLFNSLIHSGNSRHYEGYYSFGLVDSFSSGLILAQTNGYIQIAIAIIILISLVFSTLSIKDRIYLVILYIVFAVLLLGKNSPVNIYDWIFYNLPFGDSLRSTYRLFFFQMVIIYIFVYHLILWLYLRKERKSKILFLVVVTALIILPALHIKQHSNYILRLQLPSEYFIAQKFLNTLKGNKLYYPYGIYGVKNLSNSYNWSNPAYKESIVIYKNPFTSLLPINNIVQFEKYPLLSPYLLELRNVTDMQKTAKYIIFALSRRNINYIIYDDNYNWDSIDSRVNLADLKKEMTIFKRIGNLYVFKIPKLKDVCEKSYGDFRATLCFTIDSPKHFINRSSEEYILDTVMNDNKMKMKINSTAIYYRNILNPSLHEILLSNNIFISDQMLQIEGNQKKIFSIDYLKKGKYYLFIPIVKINPIYNTIGMGSLLIKVNNSSIKYIDSYEQCSGVKSYKIPINIIKEGSNLAIDTVSNGYIVFNSYPLLLNQIQYMQLQKMSGVIEKKSSKSRLKIKINNKELRVPSQCNSIEVDLHNYTNSSIGVIAANTDSEKIFDYDIVSDQKLSEIIITVDAIKSIPQQLLNLSIIKNSQVVFNTEAKQKNSQSRFYIPDEVLKRIGNNFIVRLKISNDIQINHTYLQGFVVQ